MKKLFRIYTVQNHDLSWVRVNVSSASILSKNDIVGIWFQMHHVMTTHTWPQFVVILIRTLEFKLMKC